MGGYAEHRFGKTGHFMASYAYSISLIIANIAIAVSAVGYGAAFFGVDLNATQTSQVTIVLLWFAAILKLQRESFHRSTQQYDYLGLYCSGSFNRYNRLVLV